MAGYVQIPPPIYNYRGEHQGVYSYSEVPLYILYSIVHLTLARRITALTSFNCRFGFVLPLPKPQADESYAGESCNRHGKHQGRKQIHCTIFTHRGRPAGMDRTEAEEPVLYNSATGQVYDNRVCIYTHPLRTFGTRSRRCHVRAHAHKIEIYSAVKPLYKSPSE